MSFIFQIIGRNPPMAFIIGGVFLAFSGSVMNSFYLMDLGVWCLIGGFVLQVLWLFCVKRGRF
jgi:hypothetical protein